MLTTRADMSFLLERYWLNFFSERSAIRFGLRRRTVSLMLSRLQDRRGEPSLRTRALAALVIVGMLVLTAPIVMIPLISWAMHHI
jgi:hypothetical protein